MIVGVIIYLLVGIAVSYWTYFIQEYGGYFFTIGNFIFLTILWLPVVIIWQLRK